MTLLEVALKSYQPVPDIFKHQTEDYISNITLCSQTIGFLVALVLTIICSLKFLIRSPLLRIYEY